MNEDMSDMMQKLSGMMNGKDMPKDLGNMLNNLKNNSSNSNPSGNSNNSNNVNNQDFPNFEDFSSSFGNNNNGEENSAKADSSNPFSNLDMGTIMKMKNIMDGMNKKKDDPRSNLLLSLKPYLKESRKEKVDQYIQLFNMSGILENLNIMGGEKTK